MRPPSEIAQRKPSVLAVSFFSSRGAVADNFYTLARALVPYSHLSLLTSPLLRQREIAGVRDICYVDFSKRQLSNWLSPRHWHRVWRFVRRQPYDLLFLYTEHPLHAPIGRIARGRRTVFWCHDPVPHTGSVSTTAFMYEAAKRTLLRQADHVVVACDALKRQLINRYRIPPARVTSCFHGVLENFVFSDLQPPEERDIDVLFFGRLEAYKGIDVLLDAVSRLRTRARDPNVVVAGTGPYPVPTDAGVTVDNRYLPDRELAELVTRAKIVVMPYRDATGTQVPQTAFTYGTPVVATATGCLPEYIEHEVTGLIVPPADPMRLAEALERLLDDRQLWQTLSQNARARAREIFDNDRLIRFLLAEVLD